MPEVYVPHVGWLEHEANDDVAEFLNQGWFEFREQAFLWLYLRPGDCFLDCGAHVGLFSALACRATQQDIRLLAIEPNPPTLECLKRNLRSCSSAATEIIAGAAHRKSGHAHLSLGDAGKSAYSSVSIAVSENLLQVETFTIDALLESRGIDRVDFMKLDVEGSEMDVLAGAHGSVRAGRLPVVMVEFTEAILKRLQMTTADLRRAWEQAGYLFYCFDDQMCRIQPYKFDGPIGYDNLFAVLDANEVNRRLAEAGAEHRRIAREIILRSGATKRLLGRCTAAEAAARKASTAAEAAAGAAQNAKARADRLAGRLRWIESHWSFKWYRRARRLLGDRGGLAQ